VLFSIGRALALGKRAGIVSVAGNTVGSAVLIVLVAFGIGALIAASAVAFTLIKAAGVAYLLYLGIQAIRHRKARAEFGTAGPQRSLPQVFGQGAVVGFTNPKTLAFYIAVLPQFVNHDSGEAWSQILVFGAIFSVIAFISDGAYALTAGHARDWFATSPQRMERLTAAGGVMMIALAGVLATARRA
jgi:threonine/homoserine/homoserine lactone efflux protein